VVLLILVFAGGYLALGGGKNLFSKAPPEVAGPDPQEVLRAEIEESVRETVAEQRRALDARLEKLTETLDRFAERSDNFQAGLKSLTEKSVENGTRLVALQLTSDERLSRFDATLRSALDKLAVLTVKIDELKERPVAIAPRGGGNERMPERGPEVQPEPQPEPEQEPMAEAPPQVKTWMDQLADKDAGVRFSAAVELGKSGYKGAAAKLAKVLEDDKDMFVRRAAARSLGELDAWVAVPTLIGTLQDKDIFVAIMASKALESITGQNFGFKEGLGKSELRKVVGKAKKWWEEHEADRTE
jgi:HEAT repeat protein